MYLYVAYVLDICLDLFAEQPPRRLPNFVVVAFGRLQNSSLFDTKFDASGMWRETGSGSEDKMQIVRYTIAGGLESGKRRLPKGRLCHCLHYNNFSGLGKVAGLVACFVVHAASGAYLQHFCGTWLHAGGGGGIAAMATVW